MPSTINVISGNLTVSGQFIASGYAYLPSGYTNVAFTPATPARIFLNSNGTISATPSSLSTGARYYFSFNNTSNPDLSRHLRTQKWELLTGNVLPPGISAGQFYVNQTGVTLPFTLAGGPQYFRTRTVPYSIEERFNHLEESGLFALQTNERIGIGTFQPREKMHVNGNVRIAGGINPREDNFGLNITGLII